MMIMTISALIFFSFATVGLTNVVVESDIGEFLIRSWWEKKMPEFFVKAINCHQCVGWWSGLFCSILFFQFSFQYILIAIFCAFAGSFLAPMEKVIRSYFIEITTFTACRSLESTEDEY